MQRQLIPQESASRNRRVGRASKAALASGLVALGCFVFVVRGVLPARADISDGRGEAGAAVAVGKGSWLTFRGDSKLHGYRDVRVTDAPKLRWSFDTASEVEATAAIHDGVAYVGTLDGEMLALKLRPGSDEGERVWKYKAEAGIRSSAGIRDGALFFGDDFGFVYALNLSDGKERWKIETEGGAEIISSPNFWNDLVLIGSYDGNLYALDRKTGKERWKVLTGAAVHGTAAISNGKTFVAGCDEVLRVVDLASGKEENSMPLGSNTAASPAVEGDVLYLGTFANQVSAIDWRKSRVVWTYEHPKRHFPFYASPALTRELVVIGGRDKMVHGIDRKSGASRWTFATKARVESSPIVARDRVIVGSSDKHLYMLDSSNGDLVWKFQSDGAFVASPSLAGGVLVVGSTSGLVYGFDVAAPSSGGKDAASSGSKRGATTPQSPKSP